MKEKDKETKSLPEEYMEGGDDEDSEEKEITTLAGILICVDKEKESRHQQKPILLQPMWENLLSPIMMNILVKASQVLKLNSDDEQDESKRITLTNTLYISLIKEVGIVEGNGYSE